MKTKRFCLNCQEPIRKPKFCSKKCYGQYKSKNSIKITKEQILKVYIEENKGLLDTANKLKCSVCTLCKYIKKYNIQYKPRYDDYCGQTIGNLFVIEPIRPENRKGRGKHIIWKCKCLKCNDICQVQSHVFNTLINQCCRKCAAKITGIKKTKNKIITWIIKDIERRAKKEKNLDFNLTEEFLENLLISQEYKCSLTGIKLEFANTTKEHLKEGKTTGSVDRIDSSKGYTKDNVQWVHKHINIMKWSTSQEDFINWCRMVAKRFPVN